MAAEPGSPERARYLFRDGRGPDGSLPPNNWVSNFGGPAWTRVADGQWYLHLFAPEQPDLDWTNPEVIAEFKDILRFWLDLGVDGFRIDVAHGLAKDPDLADVPERRRRSPADPVPHQRAPALGPGRGPRRLPRLAGRHRRVRRRPGVLRRGVGAQPGSVRPVPAQG